MNNLRYEYFVRRGFQCDKGKRAGADAQHFEKLKLYQSNLRDNDSEDNLRAYNAQFDEVRDALIKSLEHSKNRIKDETSLREADRIIANAKLAKAITDFETIVTDGAALYNELEINME